MAASSGKGSGSAIPLSGERRRFIVTRHVTGRRRARRTATVVAATSVIPAYIVYQLFIGNLSGRLSPSLANSYLTGQSFAFEVSAALLVLASLFSLVRARLPAPAAAPTAVSREASDRGNMRP